MRSNSISRNRKIFLITSITLPFLAYSIYYYGIIIKNAPYRFAEFDHMSIAYGPGDSLVNRYNSKTGDYQYLNKRDSIIKKKVQLSKADLLFLHRKAADLGFWDFPVKELPDSVKTLNGHNPLKYVIEFGYKRKTKRVEFSEAYDGDPKLKDANLQLIKHIQARLTAAENVDENK